MVNIIIRHIAKTEYENALEYYLDISLETAIRFEGNFKNAIDSIERFPELAPYCDNIHRYYMMKRFPYGLIYRIVGNDVLIVAVTHGRQMPGFWNDRN